MEVKYTMNKIERFIVLAVVVVALAIILSQIVGVSHPPLPQQ